MNTPQSTLLRQLFVKTVALAAELPEVQKRPGLAVRLGGWLFPLGPAIAHAIARGLLRRPDLFPDLRARETAEEVLERQQRARARLAMHHLYADLAAQCKEDYIQEEAAAVRAACQVCDQVIASAAVPLPDPGLAHRARGLALYTGLLYLAQARKRMGRKFKKAPAPAPDSPAAAPAPAPRSQRARKERLASHRGRLLDIFAEILGR